MTRQNSRTITRTTHDTVKREGTIEFKDGTKIIKEFVCSDGQLPFDVLENMRTDDSRDGSGQSAKTPVQVTVLDRTLILSYVRKNPFFDDEDINLIIYGCPNAIIETLVNTTNRTIESVLGYIKELLKRHTFSRMESYNIGTENSSPLNNHRDYVFRCI